MIAYARLIILQKCAVAGTSLYSECSGRIDNDTGADITRVIQELNIKLSV